MQKNEGLKLPQALTQYIAPSLIVLFLILLNLDFLPLEAPSQPKWGAKLFGLLPAAFWLTYVGPQGLMREGGLLMRLFRIRATPQSVALFGFAWLVMGLVCAGVVFNRWFQNQFVNLLLFGFAHLGFMAGLGVYAFMAASHKDR